jgi:hypothetical protein
MKSFILILLKASVITKKHLQTPSGEGKGGREKIFAAQLLYKKIFSLFEKPPANIGSTWKIMGYGKNF